MIDRRVSRGARVYTPREARRRHDQVTSVRGLRHADSGKRGMGDPNAIPESDESALHYAFIKAVAMR